MRPANKVDQFETVLAQFLQQVAPVEETLTPAINDFFVALREIVQLLNPLAIKDAVAAIYDTIREKTRILDPAALTDALNALLTPLLESLDALNPTNIKTQLNDTFNSALSTITGSVKAILDDIVVVINDQLRAIQLAVRALLDEIKLTIESVLDGLQGVFDQVENLIFVEVLERLCQVIDNLGLSFDQELDRVRQAFDAMLAAIPLGGGGQESAGVSI